MKRTPEDREILKKEILRLKALGVSHTQIALILGCSVSTVSYHSNALVAEKCKARTTEYRQDRKESGQHNHVRDKLLEFTRNDLRRARLGRPKSLSHPDASMRHKIGEYRKGGVVDKHTYTEAEAIIRMTDKCYLSGREIDLTDSSSYHLDHILPRSRGGDNSLDNMGVTSKAANMAKSDLTVDEFLELCIDIVRHNGYDVTKLGDD